MRSVVHPVPSPGMPSILDPQKIDQNRIALSERTVDIRFIGGNPHVAVFGGLLTDAECDALIELGKDRIQPSTVIDTVSGEDIADSDARSSYGTFLNRNEFDWLFRIAQRIAELVQWPLSRQEAIALSHYAKGQEFLPHWDYFDRRFTTDRTLHGGQRIATLVIYLNDVEAGGGTAFPQVGYEVRPQRGCGTYFTYQHPDGSSDPSSLHAGNPVLQGEKWIATFWFVEHDLVQVD